MGSRLKTSAVIRGIGPILTWWLRDGVVARGNEVSVEAQSDGRVKIDKPLRPGTVVRIHPAEGEASLGAPVLGIVTQMEGQTIGSTGVLAGREGDRTPRWDL